jgi:hypothetical protein
LAKEVYYPVGISNVLYLKPGTWGEANLNGHQGIYVNPSYFSPYWYRKFNAYLPDPRWSQLIDGSYQILSSASTMILNPTLLPLPFLGVGLMPDWVFVDDLGFVYFTDDAFYNTSTTISSWDAFRTTWRIYFDLSATAGAEIRAANYLDLLSNFYEQENNAGRQIVASYYYSGLPAVTYPSPAASGVPLLATSLNYALPINQQQTGLVQTALAYVLKSAPTNPPTNTQFSGPDTFQDFGKYGIFIAPGDILRYYINSWGLLSLLIAYHTPMSP